MAREPEKPPQPAKAARETVSETTAIYTESGAMQTLTAGEEIPEGWSRDPMIIKDPAKRTAEALSGVPKQHRHGGPE